MFRLPFISSNFAGFFTRANGKQHTSEHCKSLVVRMRYHGFIQKDGNFVQFKTKQKLNCNNTVFAELCICTLQN